MKKLLERFKSLKLNQKFTVMIAAIVLLPIVGLSSWLFYTMQQNVINEKLNALMYKQGRSHDQIIKSVDSINMSAQFFLNDQALKEFLITYKNGGTYDTQKLMDFYGRDVAALERMVNNNPYLYQIRVYVDSSEMQEMMPILYRMDRMDKLAWAGEDTGGWKFGYSDTIFDSFVYDRDRKIMSQVTPMEEYSEGRIGMLEVAMRMDTMFPALYDSTEEEWSCFIDSAGTLYFGEEEAEGAEEIVRQILHENEQGREAGAYYSTVDGRRLVASYHPVKELDGILIGVQDISGDLKVINNQRNWFIGASLIAMILLILGINKVVKSILRQFYGVLGSIREVQKGDLNVVIADCGTDEMGELGNQINKMLVRIRQLMEDNLNHERLVKNTEIRALQNQINAHFIYNVLESIKMMAEIEEKYEISDAITALGRLLRYSMRWTSVNVTVKEELEYIKNYLSLINLRFDYEIYLSLNLPDEVLHQQIPKMSLQPIVENAIYHGIEQMAEDTNIYVKGIVEGEDCIIEITDSGRGMSEEEVENLYKKIAGEIETSGGAGNGIGLKNVQDRIRMSFGEKYGIEISSKLGCYTKIMVRIPMEGNQ